MRTGFGILFLMVWMSAFSQTDTEFWFVAPQVSSDHGDRPIYFCFTTTDLPADILVKMPDNTFWTDTLIHLAANSQFRWNVTHRIDLLEHNYGLDDGIQGKSNKGIYITTRDALCLNQGEITVYYEVSRSNNPDIFALKGRNALGTEFFTSFQTRMKNMHQDSFNGEVPPYSAADIVFTEPNTFITLEIPAGKMVFPNLTGTVTLGPFYPGETYSMVPAWVTNIEAGFTEPLPGGELFGRSAEDHLAGVRVTTNGKKIAITLKDDSMKSLVGGCYDLGGDQTIPVELTGTLYIAMRGQLTTGNLQTGHYLAPPANPVTQEALFITATNNNTDIYINNVFRTTLNRGQTYTWTVPAADAITLVESKDLITGLPDSGIYVLQLTGYGCEMGEAILPSVSTCTGSTQVGFTRASTEPMYLNIMVRKNAKAGFLLNGAPTAWLEAADFTDIAGTDWATALIGPIPEADIDDGVATRITNIIDVFHLGMINGGASSGTRFGYFSNYNTLSVSAYIGGSGSADKRLCYGDSVQLVANGGIFYRWEPALYLNDPNIRTPIAKPFDTRRYVARVSGACEMEDSIAVTIQVSLPVEARIDLDTNAGCDPLMVNVHDRSYGVNEYSWLLNGSTYAGKAYDFTFGSVDRNLNTTYSMSFQNSTDLPQTHTLSLTVRNRNDCKDTLSREITVYPQPKAHFTAPDAISCHPDTLLLQSATTRATQIRWDIGGELSYADTLVKIIENFTELPKTVPITLYADYKGQCFDTAEAEVVVYPYLRAGMAVPETKGCAPFTSDIFNTSEGGIINYNWTLDGVSLLPVSAGSSFNQDLINMSDSIQHDTLRLVVWNHPMCRDSVETILTVYPQLNSAFSPDNQAGCQPFDAFFSSDTNKFKVNHLWEFGDGAAAFSPKDTNEHSLGHRFANLTAQDDTFKVYHTVSAYECAHTDSATVVAYAFIDAGFALSPNEGCSPFTINPENTSTGGVARYFWNFGASATDTISQFEPVRIYSNYNDLDIDTFTLMLRVENQHNCYDSVSGTVIVHPEIRALFGTTPLSGAVCESSQITFTNGTNAAATLFTWDFGNGTFSNEQNPAPVFRNLGPADSAYVVQLTASSAFGCADTTYDTIQVYALVSPSFTLARADSCSPFRVRITNTSSAGTVNYNWDFDDGTFSASSNPGSHLYRNISDLPRTDTLRLTGWNNHPECAKNLFKTITVYPELKADFASPDVPSLSGCNPLRLQLVNNSNAAAEFFRWDFDNGTGSTLKNPGMLTFSHINPVSTDFQVTFYDSSRYGCTHDTTKTIRVHSYLNPQLEADRYSLCFTDTLLLRNRTSPGANRFVWNFGDGTSPLILLDTTVVNHRFIAHTEGHTYPVTLTAYNDFCDSTVTRDIVVHPQVRAKIDADATKGCAPFMLVVRNESDNASPGRYFWSFGHEVGPSAMENPTPIELINETKRDRIYPVFLRVTNTNNDCWDTITLPVTVHAVPSAQFEVLGGVTTSCPPYLVELDNQTVETEDYDTRYKWVFNDGSPDVETTIDTNVRHSFDNITPESLPYNIDLTAYVSPTGCTNSKTRTVRIHPRVIAQIAPLADTTHCHPYQLAFRGDGSLNATRYEWDFADGSISNDVNPANYFTNYTAADKVFNVRLAASSDYHCNDTVYQQVVIYPQPNALFYVDSVSRMFPSATFSIDNRTNHADIWNYTWKFGDGQSDTLAHPESHTYKFWNTAGTAYTIGMKAESPHCSDTLSRKVYVLAPEPKVWFGPSYDTCQNLNFVVYDSAIYAHTLEWYLNGRLLSDKTIRNLTRDQQIVLFSNSAEFAIDEPGIHDLRLKAIGDGGVNYYNQRMIVHPKPTADFEISPDSNRYLPNENAIKLINKSNAGDDETYFWTIIENETITNFETFSPGYTYSKLGTHPIRLVVTSKFGCRDSINHQVTVNSRRNFEVPNAFMPDISGPNGGYYDPRDPTSRVFHPHSEGVVQYELYIYNRWGELVFTSRDIDIGWDGYVDNKLASQDVYVWKAKVTFIDGTQKTYAGDVTLIISPNKNRFEGR